MYRLVVSVGGIGGHVTMQQGVATLTDAHLEIVHQKECKLVRKNLI